MSTRDRHRSFDRPTDYPLFRRQLNAWTTRQQSMLSKRDPIEGDQWAFKETIARLRQRYRGKSAQPELLSFSVDLVTQVPAPVSILDAQVQTGDTAHGMSAFLSWI